MTDLLTIPARHVLAGTSQTVALEQAGYRLDERDGAPRIYARGETARSPRTDAYCVFRRRV